MTDIINPRFLSPADRAAKARAAARRDRRQARDRRGRWWMRGSDADRARLRSRGIRVMER